MRAGMKTLVVIGLAAALAGCGVAQQAEANRQAEQNAAAYKAVIASAEADYAAKKITFGQMVGRAADARLALAPNDPLAAEESYYAKLQGLRVDRGEITIEEYRYNVAKNNSDVSSKRQTRALNAVAAINAVRSQSVSCTSNRVGTFTYTNCD